MSRSWKEFRKMDHLNLLKDLKIKINLSQIWNF